MGLRLKPMASLRRAVVLGKRHKVEEEEICTVMVVIMVLAADMVVDLGLEVVSLMAEEVGVMVVVDLVVPLLALGMVEVMAAKGRDICVYISLIF